mgnify:CR=1 FL=1
MQESELILNLDGSVYHLAILPSDIANTIITVGDPSRVEKVTQHFDSIEVKKANREFVIHTGHYLDKRLTCMSTGMGTDNIDIVLNELDALVNIDLKSRQIKQTHTSLTIVRIGTSGSINNTVPVGSVVATDVAIGLESLFAWYQLPQLTEKETKWLEALQNTSLPIRPFVFEADQPLLDAFLTAFDSGITLTTGGFYAPQNRKLRLQPSTNIIQSLGSLKVDHTAITNIEMETAGLYGLSKLLGHRCVSINAIMANRLTGEFASNPDQIMAKTIQTTLDILCKS